MKNKSIITKILKLILIISITLLMLNSYSFAASDMQQSTIMSSTIFKALVIIIAMLIIIALVTFAVKENPEEIEARRRKKEVSKDGKKTKNENVKNKKIISSLDEEKEIVIEGIHSNEEEAVDEIDEIVKNHKSRIDTQNDEVNEIDNIDEILKPNDQEQEIDNNVEDLDILQNKQNEAEKAEIINEEKLSKPQELNVAKSDSKSNNKVDLENAVKDANTINMANATIEDEDEFLSDDLFTDDNIDKIKDNPVEKKEVLNRTDVKEKERDNSKKESKENKGKEEKKENSDDDLINMFLSNMEETMKKQSEEEEKNK